MKQKLLMICGPTAVGKTSLGIDLAKKFSGEIVSADSRQVYKGMDIGTGKDIDKDAKFQMANFTYEKWNENIEIGYRKQDGIPIWLVDAVSPAYQFNVADFKRAATLVIADISSRGKLPIVVGGTGLYLKSLLLPIETIYIPQNEELRKNLQKTTLQQLQNRLKAEDLARFGKMNNSDQNNPRRLIRAIEVAQYQKHANQSSDSESVYETFVICLMLDLADLKSRINQRVDERTRAGLEHEVRELIAHGVSWEVPSMSATGYRSWQSFFEHKSTHTQVLDLIKREEFQYAKRQITWFKKMKGVNTFNPDSKKDLMDKISKWYTNV